MQTGTLEANVAHNSQEQQTQKSMQSMGPIWGELKEAPSRAKITAAPQACNTFKKPE